MPSCVFKHCKSSSQKEKKQDGISFHRLPTDPVLRDKWVTIIRQSRQDNEWLPSKFSVVCSLHFKENDVYFTEKGRRFLKKTSTPTRNLYAMPPSPEKTNIAGSLTSQIASQDQAGPSNLLEVPEKPASDNSIVPEIRDSDLDSIFDTPRKSQLRKDLRKQKLLRLSTQHKLKILQKKHRRLQKKNDSLKNILKALKDKNFINCDTHNLLSDNIIATELFHNLNMRRSGKKICKYSPAIRKFCLSLNYYSPKGYDYVRKTFNSCLPHPKTLAKWYTHVKSEPGFTQEAFTALQKMAEISPHKLICALMFDEMALRQQKLWDGKRYIGVVDMGDELTESTALASQAFVFMLVGINQRFKIPLGYFLTNNLTGEQKSNLVKLCLMKCHEAGVNVVSLTFDGHATNFTTMELLGCSITDTANIKTTFKHPSDNSEVSCFLDPSHVIKLIRNQLEAKKEFLNKNEKIVDWNFISKLNKLQEDEGLHLANKLSRRHICFRNQIMKVKLATQTLSRSVAKSLQFCRTDLNLPDFERSQPTEEFVELMNDMFDIYNSRSMSHFDYRKPMYTGNKTEIYALLDRLQDYILNLQIKSVTKRKVIKDRRPIYVITRFYKKLVETKCKPGFIGTLINISSLKSLYERLIEKEKTLVYLPTYKLSQDHLEIFFGCVRMHGGHNDNPNVKQFKAIYRKLLTHLEIRSLETGNCIPLENIAILTCTSATQIINLTTSSYRQEDSEDSESDSLSFLKDLPTDFNNLAQYLDVPVFNDMKKMIVGYIAGCVIRYVRREIKCEHCLTQLVSSEKQDFHKLISLRDRGGLIFPSVDTYQVCAAAEIVIRKILKENVLIKTKNDYRHVTSQILKSFIGNLTIFINLEDAHQCYGLDHKVNLIKVLIEKYLMVRLHYIAKLETNARCSDAKRQYYKKLVQHKGC